MRINPNIVVILCCLVAVSYAVNSRCYYEYKDLKLGYLTDCVDECRDYGSLDAATQACDEIDECTGVTNEFKKNGGAKSIGPNTLSGWQLRKGAIASQQNKYNQQGYTFLKGTRVCNQNTFMLGGPIFDFTVKKSCLTTSCTSYNTWHEAASQVSAAQIDGAITYVDSKWTPNKVQTLKELDFGMVFYISQFLNTQYTTDKVQLYDEKRNFELSSCYNKCIDYASLQEAQYFCNKYSDCIGVGYHHRNLDSGSNTVGYMQGLSYQLRKGTVSAKAGIITWVKQAQTTPNPVYVSPEEKAEQKKNFLDGLKCPTVFTECQYEGQYLSVCDNNANFEWKKYKSLKVPAGQSVTIYQKDNYHGKSYTYTEDVPCSDDVEDFFLSSGIHIQESQNKFKKSSN